jgi:hypothetical protein
MILPAIAKRVSTYQSHGRRPHYAARLFASDCWSSTPRSHPTSSTCLASGSTSPSASSSSLSVRQPFACNTCSRWSTSSVVYPRNRLWRIAQDVLTSGMYITSNSVLCKSSLHVCLRMPKAFSTTPRPHRNFLLYNDSKTMG